MFLKGFINGVTVSSTGASGMASPEGSSAAGRSTTGGDAQDILQECLERSRAKLDPDWTGHAPLGQLIGGPSLVLRVTARAPSGKIRFHDANCFDNVANNNVNSNNNVGIDVAEGTSVNDNIVSFNASGIIAADGSNVLGNTVRSPATVQWRTDRML